MGFLCFKLLDVLFYFYVIYYFGVEVKVVLLFFLVCGGMVMFYVVKWKVWVCGGGVGVEGMDGFWEEGRRFCRVENEDLVFGWF